MTKVANIAKNTSYLTTALILQKVVSFTYFTLLARNLGPENLGKYYLAISFATIFAIFMDFGMANVLTREAAKDHDKANKLLGNILAIKIPLILLTSLAAVLIINILNYDILVRQLVYISLLCVTLDSFTATFFSTMRAFHNLLFESIAAVTFQLIVLAFGLTALYSGLDLRWIMGALVMASTFNFLYSGATLKIKWKLKLRPYFDKKLAKLIIGITVPFGLFAVFQRVYMYLDSVLLSVMAGDKYVGLYQVAFKIIFALQFLPMAFTASLYPAMSTYWAKNKEQLATSFERAMNYLIIISLPITFGVIALADKIILIFKEEYLEGVLALQIIIGALVFIFVNFAIGSLLNACDRQKIQTTNMGIVLLFSIVLNLILIPRWQATGASITVLLTNALMFFLGIYWAPKIIKYRHIVVLKTFIKAIISAGIMGLAVLYLKSFLNIFVVVLISAIIYFVILFLLNGFKKEDIISIWNSFTRKSV